MHPVSFTPLARQELIDALDWYESEAPGLGRRFRAAVDSAVERISTNPRQFPVLHKGIRRVLLQRFPYALMFVIDPDNSLTVIACFHGSRDPMRWQQRM